MKLNRCSNNLSKTFCLTISEKKFLNRKDFLVKSQSSLGNRAQICYTEQPKSQTEVKQLRRVKCDRFDRI